MKAAAALQACSVCDPANQPLSSRMDHLEIAERFNATVGERFATRLIGGAREPVYRPGGLARPAEIHYTLDYAQSALHELAHWCIAGPDRRRMADYGYWYVPPPRQGRVRDRFFAVESRVQGLELLLARAAGIRFHVSVDDPGAESGDFPARVAKAARVWLDSGFSVRTRAVLDALAEDWASRLGVTNG